MRFLGRSHTAAEPAPPPRPLVRQGGRILAADRRGGRRPVHHCQQLCRRQPLVPGPAARRTAQKRLERPDGALVAAGRQHGHLGLQLHPRTGGHPPAPLLQRHRPPLDPYGPRGDHRRLFAAELRQDHRMPRRALRQTNRRVPDRNARHMRRLHPAHHAAQPHRRGEIPRRLRMGHPRPRSQSSGPGGRSRPPHPRRRDRTARPGAPAGPAHRPRPRKSRPSIIGTRQLGGTGRLPQNDRKGRRPRRRRRDARHRRTLPRTGLPCRGRVNWAPCRGLPA